jgi:hypothetical protein
MSQHLPGGTEENFKRPESGYLVSEPRFEHSPQLRVQSVNSCTNSFLVLRPCYIFCLSRCASPHYAVSDTMYFRFGFRIVPLVATSPPPKISWCPRARDWFTALNTGQCCEGSGIDALWEQRIVSTPQRPDRLWGPPRVQRALPRQKHGWSRGLNPWSGHVGFVVDEVALWQV